MNKVHLEIDLTTETGKLILGAINAAVNGGAAPAAPAEEKKPPRKRRTNPKKVDTKKDAAADAGESATDTGAADLSEVTMENLQTLARTKGKGANRAKIRAKLKALGQPKVTGMPEDLWEDMHAFLTELPDVE